MDSSQEAANLANIKTARLTVWILVLTAALLVVGIFTLWLLIYPPTPPQAPPVNVGGTSMTKTGWLIIVLSSSLILAAASLCVAAFRLLRHKRMTAELARVKNDLADEKEKQTLTKLPYEPGSEIARLTSELSTTRKALSKAESEARALDVKLGGEKQEMKEVARARDKVAADLDGSQKDGREWERKYWKEHNDNTPIRTLNENYENQIASLKADLKASRGDAEEARNEKLAADRNLQGVESDRNNYRTWFNELAWLNPSIKPQKADISNYIKVIAARPCLLNLKGRVVILDLVIRNDSFFEVAIEPDTVTGKLSTKEGFLNDPAKAFVDLTHPSIKSLKPTEEKMFAISQRLLRTEAEEIEDSIAEGSDGYFWLGNLNIPISVRNAEPLDFDSKPLRMNSDIEHVYFKEFGSLTFDGEVITPGELLRNVEALPFPERARVYRELSKEYGHSLWRLNEAKQDKDPEELANEAIRCNTKKS